MLANCLSISRKGLLLCSLICGLLASGCDYAWWESYRFNKKEPYDLYALYELLEAREAGFELNRDTLGALAYDSSKVSNYVYVGGNVHLDEEDVTSLLNFVEAGNRAFMFTKHLPDDLSYHLFGPECYYYSTFDNSELAYFNADTVNLKLENQRLLNGDSLQLHFAYDYAPTMHGWNYIPEAWLCDSLFGNQVLGTLDSGRVNFLRLNYGGGALYVHTNPELFTNYYLTDSSRYTYALTVFSYLGDGPVYWDEYARNYHLPPSQRQQNPYNPNGGRSLLADNHALRYILEQPPLALAWYLFLIGGFLYVLFRGKRRQRVVPFRAPPENTSRQFVDTIARLAYRHGNHSHLAKRELVMLRQFLQERYQVHWSESGDPPADLALRTGLAQDVIDHALKQIQFVSRRDYLEEGDLLLFYRSISPIYRA